MLPSGTVSDHFGAKHCSKFLKSRIKKWLILEPTTNNIIKKLQLFLSHDKSGLGWDIGRCDCY